jgi:DNA replication ATP-dependent helicase Dna2
MSLNEHELSRLFCLELLKIHRNDALNDLEKATSAAHLLELLFTEITRAEKIQFTTMFARIAYACHKARLDRKTQYWIHFFRKKIRQGQENPMKLWQLAICILTDCISGIFKTQLTQELNEIIPEKPWQYKALKVAEFRKFARVIALNDDELNDRLLVTDEENPGKKIFVQYNIADRNEPFNPCILDLRQIFRFPVTLSITEVEVIEDGPETLIYRPKAIVIEPDYLLDVSNIAACFMGNSAEPALFLLRKFIPVDQGLPLLMGNIANFFLDELMHRPDSSFREVFPKVFKINPLAISKLEDKEVKSLQESSQRHWASLYSCVKWDMEGEKIIPADCYLEPSFYDEKHGLQGRLDILYLNGKESAIIELKSGSPFKPNQNGIGASHYIQTLLYDLMIRSVYNGRIEPSNYILYSKLEHNQLKYAPLIKAQQNEALLVRNMMVAIERKLSKVQDEVNHLPILEKLQVSRYPQFLGFAKNDLERFERAYSGLSQLERCYFNGFCGFIAREHQLSKTGIEGIENANGLASIWLNSTAEKEKNYEIIKALKILENRAKEPDPVIIFSKTGQSNQLANFRVGDIAILYPTLTSNDIESPPIQSQIFKVSIIELTPEQVKVQLRYSQFNLRIFNEFEFWNLEHDQMDFGFNAMYEGLFRFAESPLRKRNLLLSTQAPEQSKTRIEPTELWPNTTEEQRRVLGKMIMAQDYFLLWGPPGTGKTSRMLKYFADWIFTHTNENLLLLAYTNRAVDEICEALDDLKDGAANSYLRIGSWHACGEKFRKQLLASKLEKIKTRAELRETLDNHRIFVSTLASFSANMDLLKLKKFRRVVIDEASQILEPALIGILGMFEQFILIGDHKQLPAVVVQDAALSHVSENSLREIGLNNLRNSLFERLYLQCKKHDWHWAYDQLSFQGRMHQDIMQFPKKYFYEDKLEILPEQLDPTRFQQKLLPLIYEPDYGYTEALLSQKRMVFIDAPIDLNSLSWKTNAHEASIVGEVASIFKKSYGKSGLNPSIGIITPYRAQIALMQEVLQRQGIDMSDITVDTVERFQGGARDIIIISLCINHKKQLETLISLSEEGVDRKLNVAITRAREQLVVVGNREILQQNRLYRELIEFCEKNAVV